MTRQIFFFGLSTEANSQKVNISHSFWTLLVGEFADSHSFERMSGIVARRYGSFSSIDNTMLISSSETCLSFEGTCTASFLIDSINW